MMTAKEYFRQAYRLDQRINSDIREAEELRSMATSISSPALTERVETSRCSNDAAFTRTVEKIMTLEDRINREIDLLVDLKEQIRSVISTVEDTDERMVLKYRYVHNMTWEEIGCRMSAARSTVIRWHGRALQHVSMPKNLIRI
jgi:DNA-directed RNA polymerase specialized sigma subunit